MIRTVTVTNYLGASLVLNLYHPEYNGFIVKEITGLGASNATINTTEVVAYDGGIYNSSRLQTRNIVLSLAFMQTSTQTIEEVRHLSYKYFPIKRKVTLTFETDTRTASISGYVEANDPNIFSEEEGSDISIICPDPYFYSTSNSITVFSGIEAAFEFPFCNDSLTEDLLVMGEIQNVTEANIYYDGDAEIGVTITIHAIGSVSNITIYNSGTRETMAIDTDKIEDITGSGIVSGDEIIICTVNGSKSITLIRDGVSTNILNCLDKDTDWFKLAAGDNIFAYTADEGVYNMLFTVENQIAYEGI